MAPDPDPALLGSGFEGANKISDFQKIFLLISFFRYINICLQR
jgi:hypothetical protein